jgi:RNA polymerase sigma-70 factor (ECF subfamily)
MASAAQIARSRDLSDESVVKLVLKGDAELFEIIMRRHNQRLYRIARAVVRDDAEAEDVMQDAYVRAYENLSQFEGRASFSTWLCRIAFNEALARVRRRKRVRELDGISKSERETMPSLQCSAPSPEQEASNSEVRRLLEEEVEALPESYRTVFVLRDVEEINTAEVAKILNVTPENVKMRLHRARAVLRKKLFLRAGSQRQEAFSFHAKRCDRVVEIVFKRLRLSQQKNANL